MHTVQSAVNQIWMLSVGWVDLRGFVDTLLCGLKCSMFSVQPFGAMFSVQHRGAIFGVQHRGAILTLEACMMQPTVVV